MVDFPSTPPGEEHYDEDDHKGESEEHTPLTRPTLRQQSEEESDTDYEEPLSGSSVWSLRNKIVLRCLMAGVLLHGALVTYTDHNSSTGIANNIELTNDATQRTAEESSHPRRRLTAVVGDVVPSYMDALTKDLKERKKLFDDTPPEEVKYWFEYAGPLQKYFYRFSKSRAKADYFEGRDDSGVTSSRFTEEFMGGPEHNRMFNGGAAGEAHKSKPGTNQHTMQYRLLENCLALGSPARPDTNTPFWKEWYGANDAAHHARHGTDRCRALFTLNTVGAGRGTTMLWETSPPALPHAQGPDRWISEQETAGTHLQRQLEEIDAMCATNQIAARVQVLVCEPISARWTEWMDSLLPHCGGKVSDLSKVDKKTAKVEERASPVQVVVVATADSAGTCHDLKSGFMERRTQDLILAPPFLGEGASGNGNDAIENVAVKTTHPDLISSDDHDVYVGLKWTSLVTLRALSSFLQASADIVAGANAPINNKDRPMGDATISLNVPSSPFLIPSFVRVSYVSEENTKVAKWRMHGDFFHPAAWEVCKDSFELAWIDHSLSGPGGLCDDPSTKATMKHRLQEAAAGDKGNKSSNGVDCGQWWLYMTELQMSTSPDAYANEVTPPIVQGGSNFVWMVTEVHRREIVKRQVCMKKASSETDSSKKSQVGGGMPGTASGRHAVGGPRIFFDQLLSQHGPRQETRKGAATGIFPRGRAGGRERTREGTQATQGPGGHRKGPVRLHDLSRRTLSKGCHPQGGPGSRCCRGGQQ
mmetsp:Transcript_9084/g.17611  ORF Transcript_9084/g.17611 Transcript_9084/m.17611 type:complete len:759 (+) Transcript_9084:385-2661(+)